MATLAATQVTRVGVTQTLAAAAAAGDQFANTGHEVFVVHNGHGADSRTVTFAIQQTVDGQSASTDKAVTVAHGVTKVIGPFPRAIYNDVNGFVQVTYSNSAADLTVQVLRV